MIDANNSTTKYALVRYMKYSSYHKEDTGGKSMKCLLNLTVCQMVRDLKRMYMFKLRPPGQGFLMNDGA